MAGQCSFRCPGNCSTLIPSMPGLPLLAFTRRSACLQFSRSLTSSIHCSVAGFSALRFANPIRSPGFLQTPRRTRHESAETIEHFFPPASFLSNGFSDCVKRPLASLCRQSAAGKASARAHTLRGLFARTQPDDPIRAYAPEYSLGS
jgi:hypothetical protein